MTEAEAAAPNLGFGGERQRKTPEEWHVYRITAHLPTLAADQCRDIVPYEEKTIVASLQLVYPECVLSVSRKIKNHSMARHYSGIHLFDKR